MEQIKSPKYKDIEFEWCDYINLKWPEEIKTLIYCDPPYQGTKPYGYKFETDFDYDRYWNWVREMSKHHIVICSEQTFPEDFEIIWQKEVRRTMDKTNNFKAVERLGRYKLEN
jgi:site-specific DNA-adenine methylase